MRNIVVVILLIWKMVIMGGVESDVYAFDSSMTSFESSSAIDIKSNSVSDRQRRDALLHLLNEKDAYDTTHSRRSSV